LNTDINYYEPLAKICQDRGLRVLSYGKRSEHLHLEDLVIEGPYQVATLSIMKRQYKVSMSFIGKFQVLNALCAAGLVIGSGEAPERVIPLLSQLRPVRGRLELIGYTKEGGAIYVDYAHTPDALHEALLSLRPYVQGNLTLVFGCGGDRDVDKRPLMGKIADKFSDAQIITDDNPRFEDPSRIRQQIFKQCPYGVEVPDRREAISRSLKVTGRHDAVLVAGKGHEQTQIVGHEKHPFDDRQVIRDLLLTLGGQLAA
jgi:UDP-N-acetylmuramoyl-L-alanyl-D-glutamate--2,6-diaminopimelate ligase